MSREVVHRLHHLWITREELILEVKDVSYGSEVADAFENGERKSGAGFVRKTLADQATEFSECSSV